MSMFDWLGDVVKGWKELCHSNDRNFERVMSDALVGHSIVSTTKVDDQTAEIILDDGKKLMLAGNEGCGGCDNGWFYLKNLAESCNVITSVKPVRKADQSFWGEEPVEVDDEDFDGDGEFIYELFVISENKEINLATYAGGDNGYYGTGYSVLVKIEEDE